MSTQLTEILRQRLLMPRIIWMALTTNIGLLGYFLWQNPMTQVSDLQRIPEFLAQPERSISLMAASIACLAYWQAPQWIFKLRFNRPTTKEAIIERLRNLRGEYGQPLWTNEGLASLQTLTKEELVLVDAFRFWIPSFILALVLADTVAVLGFLQALNTHELAIFIPFAVVSAVMFIMRFPTIDSYVADINRMNGK